MGPFSANARKFERLNAEADRAVRKGQTFRAARKVDAADRAERAAIRASRRGKG